MGYRCRQDFFINKITDPISNDFLNTLTIKENGNVGIGTQEPAYKVDVAGNLNATGLLINGVPIAAGSNFWQANTSHVFYTGTGNIGVRTNNPVQKFHVHNGNILLTGSTSSMLFGNGGGTGGNWGIEYDGNAGGLNFWKPSGSVGGFGNYFLFLKNDGNVGVGTNNPSAKFEVNGNAKVMGNSTVTGKVEIGNLRASGNHSDYKLSVDGKAVAKSFYVTLNNWADFVFQPGYDLLSLEEVERNINEKGYLNGMPSEKEILEDGLNIGEMNYLQQIKIEELFLYIIDLNKKVKLLEQEINKLNNKEKE